MCDPGTPWHLRYRQGQCADGTSIMRCFAHLHLRNRRCKCRVKDVPSPPGQVCVKPVSPAVCGVCAAQTCPERNRRIGMSDFSPTVNHLCSKVRLVL
jgi:hypothetical protein